MVEQFRTGADRAFSPGPLADQSRVRELVETYNGFTPGNDPHGERDFGAIYQGRDRRWTCLPPTAGGAVETVLWKIEAYDRKSRS